jgi:hypothetical protein
MPKLLEREIAAVGQRLVVLAPPQGPIPRSFSGVTTNPHRHYDLLRELQRLRGRIYVQDGALAPKDLSSDGRHQAPEDERSWHLLLMNNERRITGCIWYLEHERPTFQDLRVRNCPLASSPDWQDKLRAAIECDIARAGRQGMAYGEIGGWAVAEKSRCTEGLLLALAVYSLGRITGAALGITTATARHASATILRRIGGSGLVANGVELPDYYDPKYKCQMELLRFDSLRPNPKYAGLIEQLRFSLLSAQVIHNRVDAPVAEGYDYVAVPPLPQIAV